MATGEPIMDTETKVALTRLFDLAESDTGGGRVAANFLLAWWNAAELGGFDLTEIWLLDDLASRDVRLVLAFLAENNVYPDAFVGRDRVAALIGRWRPSAATVED